MNITWLGRSRDRPRQQKRQEPENGSHHLCPYICPVRIVSRLQELYVDCPLEVKRETT